MIRPAPPLCNTGPTGSEINWHLRASRDRALFVEKVASVGFDGLAPNAKNFCNLGIRLACLDPVERFFFARGQVRPDAHHRHDCHAVSVEFLFDDPFVVVAGTASRWARRRKIDLAEIAEEPWILSPPKTWSYERVAEAFKTKGLSMPKARLLTYSMDLRVKLSAGGRFITVVPKSMLRLEGDQHSLKMLPVELPARPWPIAILTLTNRTLSPVVARFIECAREVANSMGERLGRASPHKTHVS
jgi:hypothetical protein